MYPPKVKCHIQTITEHPALSLGSRYIMVNNNHFHFLSYLQNSFPTTILLLHSMPAALASLNVSSTVSPSYLATTDPSPRLLFLESWEQLAPSLPQDATQRAPHQRSDSSFLTHSLPALSLPHTPYLSTSHLPLPRYVTCPFTVCVASPECRSMKAESLMWSLL